jgi:hypothetical protein
MKIVALKMIEVGQLASEEEVRRFQGEARAAARLDHPGIVAAHEVGVDHGQHYYAMVAGGSLSLLYRAQPVAARRAAEIVMKLTDQRFVRLLGDQLRLPTLRKCRPEGARPPGLALVEHSLNATHAMASGRGGNPTPAPCRNWVKPTPATSTGASGFRSNMS